MCRRPPWTITIVMVQGGRRQAPFAGKHPKIIKKGTKAAAAEAAVTAAETIDVADMEMAKRLPDT